MTVRPSGIILVDPTGALPVAAMRSLRALPPSVRVVRTVEEARAWRRRGPVGVVVAPGDATDVMRAVMSRPAPVLVRVGPGGDVASLADAGAVVQAVRVAMTEAAERRARAAAAVRLRRRDRQVARARRELAATRESVRRLADANVRLHETAIGLTRLVASVTDGIARPAGGSAEAVARVAVMLGRHAGLPAEAIEDLRAAALLRDVGALRQGANPEERLVVEEGCAARSARVLESLSLRPAVAETVRWHACRWDGLGGAELSGDALPLASRILGVAAAFVEAAALGAAEGCYGAKDVVASLRAASGRALDPSLVDLLASLADDENEQHRLGFMSREIAGVAS